VESVQADAEGRSMNDPMRDVTNFNPDVNEEEVVAFKPTPRKPPSLLMRLKLWLLEDIYIRLEALEANKSFVSLLVRANAKEANYHFKGISETFATVGSRLEALENSKTQERKDANQEFNEFVGTLAGFSSRLEALENKANGIVKPKPAKH
jgi:hypothetical protein